MGWDNVVSWLYCHHGAFLPPFASPNCMVIVFTFTFKKDIYNHLPTFPLSRSPKSRTVPPTFTKPSGVVRVTTWNGWFVGVSWPNPSAKRFCASSWCTTICLGPRTPTNRSLRRRENRSARSGERPKWRGRSELQVRDYRWWVVVFFFVNFCEGCDGNTLNLSNDFREKLWVT